MSKRKQILDELANNGIFFDDSDQTTVKNRKVRFNCNDSIDVGVKFAEFDRWANSTEMSFDVYRKPEMRRFLKWANG